MPYFSRFYPADLQQDGRRCAQGIAGISCCQGFQGERGERTERTNTEQAGRTRRTSLACLMWPRERACWLQAQRNDTANVLRDRRAICRQRATETREPSMLVFPCRMVFGMVCDTSTPPGKQPKKNHILYFSPFLICGRVPRASEQGERSGYLIVAGGSR